ncbi:MAG: spore maturation protein [Clostridia bacterium]|nr:spore maturation protein [Clostridia bacterium]
MQEGMILMMTALLVMRGGRGGYEAFLRGARQGMEGAAGLFPALCAMTLMISLMRASGLTELICRLMAPLTELMGLPQEAAPMLALRPISGSGSMSALQAIFDECGADSRAGRAASVLMGSSETIFYTMTVYLAGAGVRRLPRALPVSLISYLAGAAVCGLMV